MANSNLESGKAPGMHRDHLEPAPEPTPYETAVARYRIIRAVYIAVRKAHQDILNILEEEWTAAEHNLARYESSPGVPLPQYRPQPTLDEAWDGETHRGNL